MKAIDTLLPSRDKLLEIRLCVFWILLNCSVACLEKLQLPVSGNSQSVASSSRFEKVRSVVQKSFPLVWFSSKDIQSVYEQELKEPVSLSTVSTYLSRMASKGFLLRNGGSNNLKYKILTATPQAVIKQKLK